jgi:hypothetical protein
MSAANLLQHRTFAQLFMRRFLIATETRDHGIYVKAVKRLFWILCRLDGSPFSIYVCSTSGTAGCVFFGDQSSADDRLQ